MMEYKGYMAEVSYDDSVGRLHGRVINSGAYPIAAFESENVADLQREFEGCPSMSTSPAVAKTVSNL